MANTMKHTPAPWEVKDWVIKGADGTIDCGFNQANAQLIAAAPELLEACKKLIMHKHQSDIHSIDFARTEQAIAKAEGG